MCFFLPRIQDLQLLIWVYWVIRNLRSIRIMFFYVFFGENIKVHHFLHCFVIFSYLVFSFSNIKSLFVSYPCVSIELIDRTLLLLLALILLIPSVKTFSVLSLCCIFSINLLLLSILYDLFEDYLR